MEGTERLRVRVVRPVVMNVFLIKLTHTATGEQRLEHFFSAWKVRESIYYKRRQKKRDQE